MKMVGMRASIFERDEARRRLGLPVGLIDGERPRRGRNDRPPLIIATTMFRGVIDCGVPIHGTIELGVPQKHLMALLDKDAKAEVVSVKGDFVVNCKHARGTLTVDFDKQVGTFDYDEIVQQIAVAA